MKKQNLELLNNYVDTYKLQIETTYLISYGNSQEKKFLTYLKQQTKKLITYIDNYVQKNNLYDYSFISLKTELENSLNKYYKTTSRFSSETIYYKFQTLIKDIEKNTKLSV